MARRGGSGHVSPVKVNIGLGPYWKLIIVLLAGWAAVNLFMAATSRPSLGGEQFLALLYHGVLWGVRALIALVQRIRR